jgi:hypothetical protein
MRYLTLIDYSRVPDHNYPLVHFVELDPHVVAAVWRVAVLTIYVAFLAFCRWGSTKEDWKYDALAFCLLPLLEPFTPKYAFVVLLWPALALARLASGRANGVWIYLPAVIVLMQPLAPGAALQRLLQVLGMDFLATVLLLVILTSATFRVPRNLPA